MLDVVPEADEPDEEHELRVKYTLDTVLPELVEQSSKIYHHFTRLWGAVDDRFRFCSLKKHFDASRSDLLYPQGPFTQHPRSESIILLSDEFED